MESQRSRISTRLWFALMLCTVVAACQGESTPPRDAPRAEPVAIRGPFDDVMAMARAERLQERPLGEIVQRVGHFFEGKPYAAGTLDAGQSEELVIKLDGFDCVTFVETVLALARTIASESYAYESFAGYLLEQRYRDNTLDGYCSRLHYFSEWISDNQTRGNVRNVTFELGGERLEKTLNFMSRHRESYSRFAENDSLYAEVLLMEERLADLPVFHIPQERVHLAYDRLLPGDIIALATDIEGLDVAHTGLVYKSDDGATGLLHASTKHGVIVSPDLQDYLRGNKRQIGIVVARPLDR